MNTLPLQNDPDSVRAEYGDRRRAAVAGMRIFLAVITMLFLLFLIAFIARSQSGDWRPLTDPAAPLSRPLLLWINTLVLGLGSLALQWARVAMRYGQRGESLIGFGLGGLCALGFIVGQLAAWWQLERWGYGVASTPSSSFFFLLTGLHGFHLLGGLLAWAVTLGGYWRGWALARLQLRVELCAIYWHYLLALWLLLFLALTSSPQTYRTIAALCGLG
ncbi:MAG: cytochrome c oxidase subunit 3 [Oceanospirillaceae bacterium]|nr:cytochrome c oxidase subunit 3 [Oceanospirillaceae bacterium]